MIQDLHSHTYYSFCGEDAPSTIIEAAIAGGVELFGICDHCYGIAQQRPNIPLNSNRNEWSRDYQAAVDRYRDHMTLLKQKYSDRIKLAVGIEIPTIRKDYLTVPEELDLSKFDYCLIEHIDDSESVAKDIFDYAKRYGCKYKGNRAYGYSSDARKSRKRYLYIFQKDGRRKHLLGSECKLRPYPFIPRASICKKNFL